MKFSANRTQAATVAPKNESLSLNNSHYVLPSGEIQCLITYPFAKFGQSTFIAEEWCKCQSQIKCQTSSTVNHYNDGGSHAMIQDNEVVDKSELSKI